MVIEQEPLLMVQRGQLAFEQEMELGLAALHELEKLEVRSEQFHLLLTHSVSKENHPLQGRPQALFQLALVREERPITEQVVAKE